MDGTTATRIQSAALRYPAMAGTASAVKSVAQINPSEIGIQRWLFDTVSRAVCRIVMTEAARTKMTRMRLRPLGSGAIVSSILWIFLIGALRLDAVDGMPNVV